jgi:hypothetical protein
LPAGDLTTVLFVLPPLRSPACVTHGPHCLAPRGGAWAICMETLAEPCGGHRLGAVKMVLRGMFLGPIQTRTVVALYALAISTTRGLGPELANAPAELRTPGSGAAFLVAEGAWRKLSPWTLIRTQGYPLLVTIARSTLLPPDLHYIVHSSRFNVTSYRAIASTVCQAVDTGAVAWDRCSPLL